ncbi:MAG: class I SAM-dependent RNA methyltransferase [Victivallales bacterium]|nr:class I SAM-dependent RNA methyltransferase [Victivallales bacterium]
MAKKRKKKAKKPENPKIEMEISSIAYGGKGVGRAADGKVVFVPGVLPDEVALVELVKEHSDYYDGKVVELTQASKNRVDSSCMVPSGADNTGKEYFVPVPGCVYQNFSYKEEMKVKNAQFTEFIERAVADSESSDREIRFEQPVASPKDLNYRNKATFHAVDDKGDMMLGYHEEGSHAIVEMPECPLSHPDINAALREFRETKGFRKTLRDGMTLTFRRTEHDGVLFWRNNPKKNASWLKESTVLGNISVPQAGFFQVNPPVADILIERVVAAVADFAPKSVFDLYCGCGLFSLAAAKAGVECIAGLDSDRDAIPAATYNAKTAGLSDATFFSKIAERGFKGALADHNEKMGGTLSDSIIIVDPPRAGLARNVKSTITNSDLKGIVYISCSPDTLSRDIRELAKFGFSVRSTGMLDMFPRTSHFESLTILER